MSAVFQIRDLSFGYKDRAVLEAITLSIQPGEMIGLLGPNGSGKTTLLKILSAVLHGQGELRLKGSDIRSYGRREIARLIGVVQQETGVSFPYTAAEIVLMGRANYHSAWALEGQGDLAAARASMDATDCAPLAGRYLHELSGGEKQRVMIARALAQEPEILLLDEPAAFLDLRHQVQMFELLRCLNRERNLTIIAALHDLNLAALYFPRLLLLRDGKIYRDGAPADVLTENIIADVYKIRVRIEQLANVPQVFVCPTE